MGVRKGGKEFTLEILQQLKMMLSASGFSAVSSVTGGGGGGGKKKKLIL